MICSRHSLERCGRINYPQVIRQEPEQLREREQQLRGTVLVARVRLLRLLKTGQAHNLRHAAELLGYSTVQVTRGWERSRQVGLSGLLTGKARPGRPSRMTTAAWRGLQQQMKAGRISRLGGSSPVLTRTLEDQLCQREWGLASVPATPREVQDRSTTASAGGCGWGKGGYKKLSRPAPETRRTARAGDR